jgi:hypothetical protein
MCRCGGPGEWRRSRCPCDVDVGETPLRRGRLSEISLLVGVVICENPHRGTSLRNIWIPKFLDLMADWGRLSEISLLVRWSG